MAEQNNPFHIAIIPDGNRRWAKRNLLEATSGHTEGSKRFLEITELLLSKEANYVTIWAASIENLTKRSSSEVSFLVKLGKANLGSEKLLKTFIDNKIKVKVVGKWKELLQDSELNRIIENLEQSTKDFTKKHLTLLFGYSGTDEMLDLINFSKIPHKILEYDDVKSKLSTGFLPQVDLVIRTGGEPHNSSGFMMWHTVDSHYYFTETLWPDFSPTELKEALAKFKKRQRRFGK